MINNVLVWKQPNISWIHPINIDNSINANNFNFDYLDTLNKLRSSNLKILELRDIADKISDGPFGSQLKVEEYKEQGFPVYRVKNIIDTQILDDDIVYIDAKKQQQLKRSEVLPGDVLITKAGRIGSAAVVPSKFGNGNITSHLVLVRLKKTINNYYLVAYLECKYGKVITGRESYKSTRPELTKNEIGNVIIPIPSPEIQKYIGDKVRKAEELREEAKRLIKEAEEILYSQLKQEQYLEKQKSIVNKYIWLSDKEVDTRIDSQYYKPNYILYKHILNKNGIKTKKIKDVVKDIRTGTTPQSNYITKDEKRIKFLRVNNLGYCILEKDDMLYVNDKYDEKKLKIIPKGDILVSIAGTLGRSSVVDMDNCTTNQNIAALTLKNINFIKPYYLSLYLNSYFGYLSLDTISTQATVKYINNELLGEIEIPLIDIDIQLIIEEKIARYKNKINKSKQLIQEAKQDVEDLIEGNFDMSKIKVNN